MYKPYIVYAWNKMDLNGDRKFIDKAVINY